MMILSGLERDITMANTNWAILPVQWLSYIGLTTLEQERCRWGSPSPLTGMKSVWPRALTLITVRRSARTTLTRVASIGTRILNTNASVPMQNRVQPNNANHSNLLLRITEAGTASPSARIRLPGVNFAV